jgi:chromosome segregation ATPase
LKNKSFRKSIVGGFNTRDVVDYLAQMSKERREEAEALRAGADKLRRERDDAVAARGKSGRQHAAQAEVASLVEERDSLAKRAEALDAELAALKLERAMPEDGSASSEREALLLQFYEMRKERDTLKEKLEAAEARRKAESESISRAFREKAVFEGERDSVIGTLTRREQELADIVNERAAWLSERAHIMSERQELLAEREAANGRIAALSGNLQKLAERVRALTEEMEQTDRSREALERNLREAEAVKAETARLIADTRARFNEVIAEGKASSLEVVLELDRMRGFFARLSDRFGETEQGLSKLASDPRPRVREFMPEEFDGHEDEAYE